MKFPSIFASVLLAACSFCAFTSNAAISMDEFISSLNNNQMQSDAEVDVNGTLTVSGTIDLNGHNLTLKGVTGITGTGYFTGSEGSVLDVETAADVTMVNLRGVMKLIKRGEQKLSLYKDATAKNTFSGGVEVYSGVLTTAKYGNAYLPFGNPPDIVVHTGASLLPNACYGFLETHKITLDGGILGAGRKDSNVDHVFKPALMLTANSTYAPANDMALGSSIDLGQNYVLTVAPTAPLVWKPSSIANGTISLNTGNFTLGADVGMPVEGTPTASLELGPKAVIAGNYVYSVEDLTFANGASVAGPIHVYGTYKPASVEAYMPMMQGGSTLDLSGFEDSFSLDSSKLAGEVTIDLGSRAIEKNQQIISWTSTPAIKPVFVGTGDGFDKDKFTITDVGVVFDVNTETPAVAIWVGSDGDFSKVDNWIFQTAMGIEISVDADMFNKIKSILAVTIGGDIAGMTFDGSFPFASVTFENATMSEDATWDATFDLTKVSDVSKIDIGESMLTIAGKDGAYACEAEITTESANGKFRIVVPENATYTNSAFKLTGKLNLVKDGPGTMVAVDDKRFEGELIVKVGKLVCGLDNLSDATPFGAACTITLEEGGVLDPMGSINWSAQTIKMNGGKIVNTVKATGVATKTGKMEDYSPNLSSNTPYPFNPKLILLADATIESTDDFNFQGDVDDSEFALHLQIPKDHYFLWRPHLVTNLKLDVAGGGSLCTLCKAPVTSGNQPGIQLTMSGAALVLPMHNTYGSGTMEVTDYTSACTNSPTITGAPLKVYGTFTPAAVDDHGNEYFYGCTMQNDSAIDLSAKTGAWSVQAASLGKNTLEFAEGISGEPTRIAIRLGDRKLTLGEKVIAWADGQKPNFVAFFFVRSDAADQTPAQVLADGLYYGEAQIAAAEWTGEAKNGVLSDPANWKGDKLPNGELTAKFTGNISTIVKPEADAFTCKDIYFNNVTLTEPTDLSWIDLNKITDVSVIDIMGQTLKIASTNSISTTSATITDSVGGGAVEFTVGEGVVHTNATLAFEGGLKFVKQGEGVFVAAKYPQLYTNVTEIAEGILRCGVENVVADGNSPFGTSLTIDVKDGAVLDPAGSYNWTTDFILNLNGGIISNTVKQIGANTTAYNAGSFPKPFNPTLSLKADSLFVSPVQFNFNGVIQPNGNKLTVCTAEELRWAPVKVNAAEVEFTGGGQLVTLKKTPPEMSDITLVMNDFTFDVGCLMVVSNYTAKAGKTDSVKNKDSWHDGGGMTVSGVFTPTADKFFGCQLLDGSTIDLSGKTDVWSTTTVSTYKNGPLVVTFADGATVTIDVHGRALRNNEQIVSWTEETKPEYFDNLTFKIDAKSKKVGYKLDKRADGIYAVYSGLSILLK